MIRDLDDLLRTRRRAWERLAALVTATSPSGSDVLEMAALARATSHDAARARMWGADDETIGWLDHVLARAHAALYRPPPARLLARSRELLADFARTLRSQWRFFAAASAAFYGTFAFGLACGWALPGFAQAVIGPESQKMFREMYASAPDDGRSVGAGALAVSFYVQHNTTIALQVFATGIFAGVGSLWMLAYQGLVLGTVFGFLVGDAKGHAILTFAAGHTAWELTGIVVAGTAGLRLGWALVETGGCTRLHSLRQAGRPVLTLVAGATVLLATAAAIEGLWSPSTAPAPAKWAFGVVQVGIVAAWLRFGGRPAAGAVVVDPRSGRARGVP